MAAYGRYFVVLIVLMVDLIHVGTAVIHNHPKNKAKTENYKITAFIYSGRKEEPNWTIQPDAPLVNDILQYADEVKQQTPQLSSDLGYKGIEIDHMIGGASVHKWTLPKCARKQLELDLLNNGGETVINTGTFNYVIGQVNKCPDYVVNTA